MQSMKKQEEMIKESASEAEMGLGKRNNLIFVYGIWAMNGVSKTDYRPTHLLLSTGPAFK